MTTTEDKLVTLEQNARDVGSSCYWGEQGDWFIAAAVHRDSDVLDRSNFQVFEERLRELSEVKKWKGDEDPIDICRFSHWAVGWVDYLIVHPDCKTAVELTRELQEYMRDRYPVLDDEHYSRMESEEADEIWKNCHNEKERIEYIRGHESQFEFRGYRDMLGCVRGKWFSGYASELIGR